MVMKARVIQKEPEEPTPNDRKAVSTAESTHSSRLDMEGRGRERRGKIAIALLLAAVVFGGAFLASRPGGSNFTAAPGAATAVPDFAAKDAYVEAEVNAQRIPGLALAIVRNGRIIHMHGFGDADPAGREVSPQTPFVIGSLAKSFTTMAIMQLVEAGRVELSTPQCSDTSPGSGWPTNGLPPRPPSANC
jgi:outer membrane murein-binding lipoprotein Lpp